MPVNDSDLFLSLPRRASAPAPRADVHLAEERQANLRRTWSEHIGPVTVGDDDFEEFYEEAARLDAAVYAFLPRRVWMAEYADGTARNLGTGEVVPLSQVQHLRRYGGQPASWTTGVPPVTSEGDIERYHEFAAFTENAGRPVLLAGHDIDGRGLELLDAIRQVAAAGYDKVVVKVTKAKHGLTTLDVSDGLLDDQALTRKLYDELDWVLMSHGGRVNAFLVQGFVSMRFEYRFFIVDGLPVTGAGCIVAHTPANHRWEAFDTRVQEYRFDPTSPVIEDDALVRRLTSFAVKVANQWKRERPDLGTAVIDVALDEQDEPLVVEFNGILNAGLYASDPRAVTVALASNPALPDVEQPIKISGAMPLRLDSPVDSAGELLTSLVDGNG
ncbi:ATP-grasp domain-containing protein [Curtobacterium sp. MCSS17_016]|uniref:ATP-grasp domain-containing protein n=1 Tax=Curtobacterium sp. MCSS17_016 TaxID=2175644 RepID=UPI000DA913B0|nr:ATP-grasp domain-containing protein [Curtobacterium sp. MCSS17_016]WIE81341.1 ATP-grasp domain-containing protein [Curtobacterium sp. MCSS17_016]